MPANLSRIAEELSVADLKRLLKLKEEMTVLESRREALTRELSTVEAKLKDLRGRADGSAKKPARRTRPVARKAGAKGKPTVAGVVAELIRAAGRPLSFSEIHDAVVKGKLITSRSKNFANVLRRTLSTSDAFVRVERGVYGVEGVVGKAPAAKRSRVKAKAAKKTVKKTAKKAAKKTVKKAAKKKVVAKAKPKKTTRAKTATPTLEDVVVRLLKAHRKPMPFQDLLKKIRDGKLVKSRAKDFSNVLRRTLSTSKRVKREGRGVYGLA